ncbi:hypothetical protein TruAng_000008 [Truncatella angustata]|nr:hypothetical protein TruAng_000008 [Truncatella angustata]
MQAKALTQEIRLQAAVKNIFTLPANRRAMIAACGLMFFQQMCGFNTMMYCSSTLFAIVSFKNPVAVGTIIAAINWLFTVVSIIFINKIGRRRILIWTMWGMPHTGIHRSGFVDLFVAFYAVGLGWVPWQANEFLPMEVRALGTTGINNFNWGPNIIVSSTFLSMMKGITPAGTFGFYACTSFLGWIYVVFCFPEAANMTLEEVRAVFQHGFGVRYAEAWRKKQR